MNTNRSAVCAIVLLALFAYWPSLATAQWASQQLPEGVGMLLTVDFSDSMHGAASGYNSGFSGRAVYTTDGGIHWELAVVPDSSRSLVTLQMVDADTGYIAGAYNVPAGPMLQLSPTHKLSLCQPRARGMESYLQRIGYVLGEGYRALFLRTTDGGKTWQTHGVLPDSMGYLIGASFVDAHTGYVTGDGLQSFTNVAILKTTDGGSHWRRMPVSDSVAALRNIRAIDADHAVAVGYTQRDTTVQGVILKTTDGGVTWTEQIFPTVDNFTDVFFSDDVTGYAVGASTSQHGIVLKTTNAGTAWEPLFTSPDTVLLDVVRFLPGTNEGFVEGQRTVRDNNNVQVSKPLVRRTIDGGTTWSEEPLPDTQGLTMLVGAEMLSHGQAYLSGGTGALGAMFRFTDRTLDSKIPLDEPPASYSLSQNYPNPFNPTTVIRCQLPVASRVQLIVYNMLGQKVAELVNGEMDAGYHETTFNGAGLASGVYFYRLMAGEHIQTRSMILVK